MKSSMTRRSGLFFVFLTGLAFVTSTGLSQHTKSNSSRLASSSRQPAQAQQRTRPSNATKTNSRSVVRTRSNRNVATAEQALLNPKQFLHPCYKLESLVNNGNRPLQFLASDSQWDQPAGPGTTITLTYSYSNLLNGEMRGLTTEQLRRATEEAMTIWASVVPINFVEVADVGPIPTASESSYPIGNSAQIRIGTHVMDGVIGGELAHAYLPFSNSEGIAGDLHFDIDEDWSINGGGFFLETMLHELGHCLGLDHEEDIDAIMNPVIRNRFNGLDSGFLLADDIAGIRSIYGAGSGVVSPISEPDEPTDEPTDTPTDGPPVDNNVTAERDTETGHISLLGDSFDNSLLVVSSRWFVLVLAIGDTTVNEKRTTFWCQPGDRSLEIIASNGQDTVYLFGVSAVSASIDLGADDDRALILFSRLETLDSDGGEGDDGSLKFFNRIEELIETGFETIW